MILIAIELSEKRYVMVKRKDITTWCIPVPRALDKAVEDAVKSDYHITKSDLVRDAVREKLASMGYKSEPFKEIQVA